MMINNNFNELISTFKSSIKTWDYFVNWKKVFKNKVELEISLNKLNYLLGKDDFDTEFKILFKDNRDIAKTLPVLLAVRDKVLEIYDINHKTTKFYDFDNMTDDECIAFVKNTGLINLFKKDGIKNLVDYVIGVEVGLDSNGRKNRGGTLMESIVESYISDFCNKNGYKYLAQASSTRIFSEWGIKVEVNKTERSFDFAVYNPQNDKVKLFETNFYNGGGSKLKSVCGEFRALFDELEKQNIDLIWITDGLGWNTTKKPLEETFNHNKYVFNLNMVEDGVLNSLNW